MKQSPVNKVFNLILLDESGSMESIKMPTINGFNELLASIRHSMKEHPGIDQYINFYSFNGAGITEHLPLCKAEMVEGLSPEQYNPDHMTPLYDAIGYSINRLKNEIKEETGYSVLVTILTDGEENHSREYSFESVAALIKEMRSQGWVFTYIGANHDVEKTAISLNINNNFLFEANEASTQDMFQKNISSRKKFMNKLKSNDKNLDKGFFE